MMKKTALIVVLCILGFVFACGYAETAAPAQSVPLSGVRNARELGGYRTENGKTVRQGVLLRTAKLSGATDEDIRVLTEDYHLAEIIDFRGDMEIESFPDPDMEGVTNLNVQIIGGEMALPEEMQAEMEELASQEGEIDKMARLRLGLKYNTFSDQMYVDFLSADAGKAGYRQFFTELLALPAGRSVLFHCSEGKDRTGCAAMLLLFALGADEETVMEDFLLTNVYNADLIEADRLQLKEAGFTEEDMESCLPFLDQVSPAFLKNAITWMTENYGSPLGYITGELGMTEADFSALRDKFLE